MNARHRSGRRTVLLVGGAVVAAAFAFVLLSTSDAQPPVAHTDGAAAVLHATAPAGDETADSSPSTLRTAAAAAAATPPPRTAESPAIVLEVQDSAGGLVCGAHVLVIDDRNRRIATEMADDGTMRLPQATAEVMAGWRAAVTLPGRRITQPLRLARPGVVAVSVGEVGKLRFSCDGAAERDRLQVTASLDGKVQGLTGDAVLTNGCGELSVAAGGLEYRVVAEVRGRGPEVDVVGPRRQSDVVDVHLDLRPCRVIGQFTGASVGSGRPVSAVLFGAHGLRSCTGSVASDGSFSVLLPRMRIESLVFVVDGMCAVCPPISLDADERDVGPIPMFARPCLGWIEVRDDQGVLHAEAPSLVYFKTASGTQLRPSDQSIVRWDGVTGAFGCFAIPGIVEVGVAPAAHGLFAEPKIVAIRDGGLFSASLTPGGRVVVLLSAPGMTGLCELWLEDAATKERVARRMARFQDPKAGLQRHEFRNVPPGHYKVGAKDIEIVVGSLEVPGGSDQEIAVSVRPQ